MTIFTDVKNNRCTDKKIGTEHVIERLVLYVESGFIFKVRFYKMNRV